MKMEIKFLEKVDKQKNLFYCLDNIELFPVT